MDKGNDFNTDNLLILTFKWKWHLIAVAVIAAVAATVFSSSYFIEPKFKSTAVVYPVNIVPYSNESATEQLLQIFQSIDVKKKIIEKFDLANHYGIGDNSKYPSAKLFIEFNDNVSISKTEFESINIEIYDKDPVVAFNMVNSLIDETNLKQRELQRSKSLEMHNMYENQLALKRQEIDSLQKQISNLRVTNNIINVEYQTKEVTRNFLNTKGGEANEIALKMKEKGAELTALELKLEAALNYETKLKNAFDDITGDLNKELTYTNVVTQPFVADSKSYPIRWLIVSSSILAALFITFIYISFVEGKKKSPSPKQFH